MLMISCALLAICSCFFAIGLGATCYSPMTVLQVILESLHVPHALGEPDALLVRMVYQLRMPRVLLGFVVGASLATCGVSMQALVRNKLADPFVLGVSSGASALSSIGMVFGLFSFLGRYALPLTAIIGAAMSIIAVYVIGHVKGRIQVTQLLLGGVAVAMVMDAVTSYVGTAAPNAFAMHSVNFWLLGSLAGAKWAYLGLPTLAMAICTAYLLTQYRGLNALATGDDTAASLGVDVSNLRRMLVLISSILAGVAISVSGSIGFVGMIVPHLCRGLVGADHKKLLPLSLLIGGMLVVWADVAARMVAAPEELPVGVLTALCGAPVFLVILKRRRAVMA